MSAENAWKVAMEAASHLIAHTQEETSLRTGRRYLGKRAEGGLTGTAYAEGIRSLPMPPAFRAAVEAEAEELREALGRIRDETLLGASHGLGDRIYSIASGALSRLEAKGESHE